MAIQNGLVSALCTCLLVNGFVGFQLYEDGTALSVWLIRIPSAIMFAITFVISLLTFKSWSGGALGPENTVGMFVVLYIINAICIAIYTVMQLLLVVNTLDDRWPLGHICFGVAVFIIGQVLLYAFSDLICNNVQHYMDGLFFATFCNLLAVMMVYKVRSVLRKFRCKFETNWSPSSGIRSRQKILNSPSVSRLILGRLKTFFQKKTDVKLYTKTPTPNTGVVYVQVDITARRITATAANPSFRDSYKTST